MKKSIFLSSILCFVCPMVFSQTEAQVLFTCDKTIPSYYVLSDKGNANYSDIEHIVVPKDEFPLQNYQTGDVIDFNIVEVKSEYPPDPIGYVRHTVFLCSIKQCK